MDYFIKVLGGTDQSARQDLLCRFPARALFLHQELQLTANPSDTMSCRDLADYTRRAPADQISLVFAAENISHPMSMLGHVFLRLEGISEGVNRDHAASFYTTIESANIPSVLLDSFLLGMPSRFVLLPYKEQIPLYLEAQGRNVWEYKLALTPYQRKLIHLHIWELRDVNSKYLFVGYNCATVVYITLSLAAPELITRFPGWVAPIGVVRAAYAQRLVGERALRPSIDWLLRAYENEIGSARAREMVKLLKNETRASPLTTLKPSPLDLAYIQALSDRASSQNDFFGARTALLSKEIEDYTKHQQPTTISVENVKDPINNPPLSRISVGHSWIEGDSSLRLEYRPASHSLADLYRGGITESGLELGATAIRIPSFSQKPRVESLKLYNFESLVPWSSVLGGNSTRVSIGVEEHRDREFSTYSAASFGGGIGRSYQLGSDFLTFGFLNLSLGYGDGRSYVGYGTELGAILYEVFDMKSVARFQLRCGEHGSQSCYNRVAVEHSIAVSNTFVPYGRVEENWSKHRQEARIEVGLRLFF